MKKIALIASLLCSVSAHAANYTILPMDNGSDALVIAGEIQYTEENIFNAKLAKIAADGHTLLAVVLDSTGGNVYAAESIANVIRERGYVVVMNDDAVCASSCFLLLAASKDKRIRESARVGVHSASVMGKENADAAKVTLLMIADLKDYGVPPVILGKMASTANSEVSWLTNDELRSMGVAVMPRFVEKKASAHTALPAPTPTAPAPKATSAAPAFNAKGDIDFHGSWKVFLDAAVQWSAHDFSKPNVKRVNRGGGFYNVSFGFYSSAHKYMEVTEAHFANGDIDNYVCIYNDLVHKSCRGWGRDVIQNYVKEGKSWNFFDSTIAPK